jgi:hypothetical protein
VRPAAVDHGGDISEYSQFPGEREYLWNPCSLLESNGEPFLEVTRHGIVTIIPVRMNNNVKTMTVEQLLEQKKRMHISGFEFLLNEVKFELARVTEERVARGKAAADQSAGVGLLQWIVEGIVEECQATLQRHRDVAPLDYIDDEVFRRLVIEMLESKSHALSKVRLCREALKHMGGDGLTPLMLAAGKGDAGRVKELVLQGADVNATNRSQRTALHEASGPDVIRTLLDCKATVNARDSAGRTALHTAAEQGRADAVRILVEWKAVLDTQDLRGRSGLHCAAEKGHGELVRLLVEAKADFNAEDAKGLTPLDVSGSVECSDALKAAGADGWTPLILAAEKGAAKLESYFRFREAVLSISKQAPFPKWFVDMVSRYEGLKAVDWTWGACEPSSMTVSADKLTVKRSSSSPDYSCALGSQAFDEGVHIWSIRAENVTSMHIGIARGVEEGDGLGLSPGSTGKYMLALDNSSSELTTIGRGPSIQRISGTAFSSGKVVELELDTSQHKLKVGIDGRTVLMLTNIEDKGTFPFICMAYEESATLESRYKCLPQVGGVAAENRQLGLNNLFWTKETDAALAKLSITGLHCD